LDNAKFVREKKGLCNVDILGQLKLNPNLEEVAQKIDDSLQQFWAA